MFSYDAAHNKLDRSIESPYTPWSQHNSLSPAETLFHEK